MIELERTFLVKTMPEGIEKCKKKEIIDIYYPKDSRHPILRLRKDGDRYELTKKSPVKEGDASRQKEQTIILTKEEFESLSKLPGKKVRKIRYFYGHEGVTAEIDVFKDALEGLVIADFEFGVPEEKEGFIMPGFCLAEVTQEESFAGGMLCGKSYEEIAPVLAVFGYEKPL
jgi:adenylate cyclase